jgi:uncharacterized membrane protein YgcG
MNPRRTSVVALSVLTFAAGPAASFGSTVILTRDTVVPVVFDSALTISDSRVGDRFTCHVDADRDLPTGTKFEGRIVAIRVPRSDRPASMDLEFTEIDLPGGASARIHAVPIPLNKDLVRTDANGRLYVKDDVRKQGEYVLGGALGGYLLGSIFHRRITGLFLGTVAGMVAASADHAKSENTVVDRGLKMGALFNQDVTIDTNGGAQAGDRGWDSSNSGGNNRGWDSSGHSDGSGNGNGGSGNGGNGGWDSSSHGGAAGAASGSGASNGTTGGRGWDSGNSNSTTPAPGTQAQPERDVAIRFGDKAVSFDADAVPYYEGETIMVPVEKMAGALGLSFDKGDRNSVYIENEDNSLKLEQDSVTYRLNGKRSSLSHPAVLKHGMLYAPVEVFAPMASKDLLVNGTKLNPKND